MAFALEARGDDRAPSAGRRERDGRGRWRVPLALLAALFVGSLVGALLLAPRRPRPRPPTPSSPSAGAPSSPRASRHDGQTVVYSAAWDGQPAQVYATRIGSREARPLGIEGVVLSVSSKDEVAVKRGRFLGRRTAGQPDMGTLARCRWQAERRGIYSRTWMAADWDPEGQDLAVLRRVEGKKRLEYPIGHVVDEAEDDLFNVRVLPGGRLAIWRWRKEGKIVALCPPAHRPRGRRPCSREAGPNGRDLSWSQATQEILFVASREGEEAACTP